MDRRDLRVAHLTTVDMSLTVLLGTELRQRVEEGVRVFGISAPGPFVDELEAMGVTHVPIPSFSRSWGLQSDLRAAGELVAALRRIRPHVLHTHTPKAGVLGRLIGRALNIPIVVNTCHGLWATREDTLVKRALVVTAEALASAMSHAELYQNDEDRRRLSRWVARNKTLTVGNGVDLQRFRPDPESRARVRAEWGVAPGEVLIGGVGRRVAEKGIAELGHAARALGDRARFVWVGPDDPSKPDALREAEQGITFLGYRSDMPAVYAALDIFCLPSHREGFSRSGMEAAASGCAVVLSDIRGCRELGRHGEHLLLVPPGDGAALTETLTDLLQDPVKMHTLRHAMLPHAREHFEQRAVARRSWQAYRWVAAQQRDPHVPALCRVAERSFDYIR